MARNHDDAGLYDCVTYTICGYRIYADDESIDTVAKLRLSSPREYTLIRDVRDSFCISLVLCFESCKIDCPEDVLLINSFGRLNKGLNLILTCILFDTMALPSALQAQPILGGGNCTIATYPPSRCPGPDMGCCEYCICLLLHLKQSQFNTVSYLLTGGKSVQLSPAHLHLHHLKIYYLSCYAH